MYANNKASFNMSGAEEGGGGELVVCGVSAVTAVNTTGIGQMSRTRIGQMKNAKKCWDKAKASLKLLYLKLVQKRAKEFGQDETFLSSGYIINYLTKCSKLAVQKLTVA
jgi:hypothetical protein